MIARLLPLRLFCAALLVAGLLPVWTSLALASATIVTNATAVTALTTITVDSSADPDNSLSATCTYRSTVNAPAADGKCTLRRAIVEASARPQSDRPIAIVFNLPDDDPNRNRNADGTWTILLSDALPPLGTASAANLSGQVQIDGATQPNGRSNAPKILIDTGDHTLEIAGENNQIRNLALLNGGSLVLSGAGNLVENLWLGLSGDGRSIPLRESLRPSRLSTGGIVVLSSNNIVRHNIIAGASAPAILVLGSGNQITGNQIGARADGTLPQLPTAIQCLRSLNYDPANWYGGRGILIQGSNHTVVENRIVGLHVVQAPHQIPPTALEIAGTNHIVERNIIGIDSADGRVGVCGQGIELSGTGTQVLNNTIAHSRSGFADNAGNALASAIIAGDVSTAFGAVTLRGNIVDTGPGKIYALGPLMPDALRNFAPARITELTAGTVKGGNGVDAEGNVSACPNCVIDFYLDDLDDIGESLSYLGSTTADASGAFSFALPQPLTADQAIRTTSTTTSAGVIGNLGAGTTSVFSGLYLNDIAVEISGPSEGDPGEFVPFTIKVIPAETAIPVVVSFMSTDNRVVTRAIDTTTSLLSLRWTAPGLKTVQVAVETPLASAIATHQIQIRQPAIPFLYLPYISR